MLAALRSATLHRRPISSTLLRSMSSGSGFHSLRYEVHGRVQGVNFRSHVQKHASAAGITGWVRNTDKDTVEGEAEGSEQQLQSFIEHLNRGSSASKVEKVDTRIEPVDKKQHQGFQVR